MARGTGYKTHPITAVCHIKSLQESPLCDDEIKSYTTVSQSWFDTTFAKLKKEAEVQAKSHVASAAVTQETTPASPAVASKGRTRECIPHKAVDKKPQRYFFLLFIFAVLINIYLSVLGDVAVQRNTSRRLRASSQRNLTYSTPQYTHHT